MKWVSGIFAVLAAAVVIAGAGLVIADFFSRYLFNSPFRGTAELVGWLAALAFAFAAPAAAAHTLYRPSAGPSAQPGAQIGVLLTVLLTFTSFAILAVAAYVALQNSIEFNERTMDLGWPRWPLAAIVAGGFAVGALCAIAAGVVFLVKPADGDSR